MVKVAKVKPGTLNEKNKRKWLVLAMVEERQGHLRESTEDTARRNSALWERGEEKGEGRAGEPDAAARRPKAQREQVPKYLDFTKDQSSPLSWRIRGRKPGGD